MNAPCLSVMMAKEKPPITVVGDVGGRIAIIVVRSGAHTVILSSYGSKFSPISTSYINALFKLYFYFFFIYIHSLLVGRFNFFFFNPLLTFDPLFILSG